MFERFVTPRRTWVRSVAVVAAGALVASFLTPTAPAAAAPPKTTPGGVSARSVPMKPATSKAAARTATDGPGVTRLDHATWPGAGAATVAVGGGRTLVGSVPVTVDGRAGQATTMGGSAVGGVRIQVLDQTRSRALGLTGVLFTAAPAGATAAGSVRLKLDYSAFANAYGANFGARLRLVQLPACALTTPAVPACQRRTDLGAVNAGDTLTADVTFPRTAAAVDTLGTGGGMVFAATSSASSADGTFSATSLSPAYSWAAGNPGGSFTFDYPLRVPASIGGPSPKLSLSYDSAMVDAQTLAENGQTSWVGEGWEMQTGYIERSYRVCSLNGGTTSDLCWFSSYNATMVFNGASVRLIRDNTTGVWHASTDTGLKVEALTDPSRGNGDNDGEYWRVTTLDGTQYYFGANKRYAGDTASTNSTQVVPVFGNDAGEPCHGASFAASWCQQAYRWNLDYVVDPRGNSMTYFYSKTTGRIGLNTNTINTSYDIDSVLDHIDYGTRAGSEASQTAPVQVYMVKSGRCVGACAPNTSDYPDTPWDLYCSSTSSCPNVISPAYWTQYKLSTIYSQIWTGSSYHKVDQWDLGYTFPSTGDNISPAGDDTAPNLWLQTVTHTGYATDGVTTMAEAPVTFGGTPMFNRVDWGNDIGVAPYTHYRLSSILNGMGGQTLVTYSAPQCDRTFAPMVEDNPYRCFPEYFKPSLAPAGWGWFQKYVVTGVTDRDLTGGSPDEVWTYAYSAAGTSDPALWHHDYTENVTLAYRSWSLWSGYPTVTITHGAAGNPQTVTKNLYQRGMDGDGKATTDNSAILWNTRRVSLTTGVSPAGAAAISGTGGLCLNLAGGGTADGTNIEINTCTGAANQVFHLQPGLSSPSGPIVNAATGKCVDVNGAGTANGTNVQLWTCNGGAAQLWARQPDGSFINPNSGRCLDNNGATITAGANVDIWDCANNQYYTVWQQRDDGSFVQPQSSRCLDITGGGTADGTKIENWTCTGGANQQWQLQSNGELVNPATGKCIDVIGGATANGTQIQLATCTAATNQLWTAQANGTLKNTASGRCLDAGTAPAGGSLPYIQDCGSGIGQQWVDNVVDADGTQGFQRESNQFDGATFVGGSVQIATVTPTALRSAPVTGGQDLTATMLTDTDDLHRVWLASTSKWRWTEKQTTYNAYGLPTFVKSLGDVAVTTDDTCATTTYVTPDTAHYLVDFPAQTITTDCAATPRNSDYLSGHQVFYDGSTVLGATPTAGLSTKTTNLATVSGTTFTWKQDGRNDYDANGRPIAAYDALDHKTTTAYTPASGAPVTSVTTTNPLLWTTTSTIDPGKGSVLSTVDPNNKTTQVQYDPLGRLTKAWMANRPTTTTPDKQYVYNVSATVPNSIETRELSPSGAQISSFEIFDGRTRLRQAQTPAPAANGGRMIADTQYDSRGFVVKSSGFWNSTAPSGTLGTFADTGVPTQHRFTYDNLERKTADQFYSNNVQEYQTTYAYQGDRATETPPAGGTTMQTFFDARGNITSLRQYVTVAASGTYQATSYSYDRFNRMTQATDPATNKWTRKYDLRGRVTSETNPDTGTTSYTYDDADEALTATDGTGAKVAYTYDAVGRRTNEYQTSTSGALLDNWTYDTLAKGQPTASTSYVGTTGYTVGVTAYDDSYHPLGVSVVIPAGEGGLTGTWTTSSTYNVDNSPASITYPAAGGLGSETVNYTYDAVGFQLTAVGLDTYVSAAAFQPWGDLYQQTLGTLAGGKRVQVTTDEYPDTHRPKSIQVGTESPTTPGTYLEQLTQAYHWDPSGNLTSIDNQHAGATTDSQCFQYDFIQELTTAWTTTPAAGGCATAASSASVGGADPYWTTWTYDTKTGNRATQVQHGLGGAGDTTSTYTYPAAGAAHPHGLSGVTVTGPGGTTSNSYLYNAFGQQTNATVNALSTDFTWTPNGAMGTATTHAVGGDQATTYIYDATGAELIRKTPNGNTLYLGGTEINTNSAGVLSGVTRFYTCNGATVASRTSPGGLTWQADDHEGTAQIAISSTTLAPSIRKQDPFGNPRGAVPAWPNQHGFVGGTSEPTGLVHLGERMYDPVTGRFVSSDHVLNVGNPQQMNGYAYAENDPTSDADPTGLASGSTGAHDTAVVLRAAALRAKYPNATIAVIDGALPSNQGGPDLVCYNCVPGVTWVWEFKPDTRSRGPSLQAEIQKHINQAKATPLAAGTQVIAGPTFASLGVPPQVGAVVGNDKQLVTVYDPESGPSGLQVYKVTDNDDKSKKGQKAISGTNRAVAKMKNEKSNANTQQQKASTPQPTSAPPSANSSTGSFEEDGVVPGSFFGDVALFAGVIFAGLVLIWGGIEIVGAWIGTVVVEEVPAVVVEAEGIVSDAFGSMVDEGVQAAEHFANWVSSWW